MINQQGCDLSDTWLLDIGSMQWREHTEHEGHNRIFHTATKGKDGCALIYGGTTGSDWKTCTVFNDMYSVILQAVCHNPKRLEDMAIQTVYRNRQLLKPQPYNMPHRLYERFCEM